MKTRSVLATLLVLAALGTNGDVWACGNKFLSVGRGTRYQHAAAPHRGASILLYAGPGSNLREALTNVPLDTALRKAGYWPKTVTDTASLDLALREGDWDLVVVEVNELQAIRSRLRDNPAPVVLAVLYNPTGAELKQAKKQHQAVIKSPVKQQAFLDAIDDALSLRPRHEAGAGVRLN